MAARRDHYAPDGEQQFRACIALFASAFSLQTNKQKNTQNPPPKLSSLLSEPLPSILTTNSATMRGGAGREQRVCVGRSVPAKSATSPGSHSLRSTVGENPSLLPTKPGGLHAGHCPARPCPGSRNLHPAPQRAGHQPPPLGLLPQIQVVWRQLLLAVSIPNGIPVPPTTPTAVTSKSPPSHSPPGHRCSHLTRLLPCLVIPISIT